MPLSPDATCMLWGSAPTNHSAAPTQGWARPCLASLSLSPVSISKINLVNPLKSNRECTRNLRSIFIELVAVLN
jgi:hypothetical protein